MTILGPVIAFVCYIFIGIVYILTILGPVIAFVRYICIGIFYIMTILGPAIAFIGAGALLDIYVDVDTVDLATLVHFVFTNMFTMFTIRSCNDEYPNSLA